MGSLSHHITPLVINSLGGGHTPAYRHSQTEAILRNQARAGRRPARAWFKNTIQYKISTGNIDKFDEFQQFVNFSYQNFQFSELLTADEFVGDPTAPEIKLYHRGAFLRKSQCLGNHNIQIVNVKIKISKVPKANEAVVSSEGSYFHCHCTKITKFPNSHLQ